MAWAENPQPIPDKLHLDGYRIETTADEYTTSLDVVIVSDGQEVDRRPLWACPNYPEYQKLVPSLVRVFTELARHYRLMNSATLDAPRDEAMDDLVRDGIQQLAFFCRGKYPFALADWDYVSSRAPDDHLYKHRTEDRFLRVLENQWTEELTPEELGRMLARDQEADDEDW